MYFLKRLQLIDSLCMVTTIAQITNKISNSYNLLKTFHLKTKYKIYAKKKKKELKKTTV